MNKLLSLAVVSTALVGTVTVGVSAQPAPRVIARGAPQELLTLRGPGASIGVSVRELRTDEAQALKVTTGVYIESIRDESPASRAGFKMGDVVVEFDGEPVRSVRQFTRVVQETAPGRTVKAVVVRNGNRQTLNVTPEAGGRFTTLDGLPDDLNRQIERGLRNVPRTFTFDLDDALAFGARGRLGATVSPISDQLAEYFGVKNGVLVASVTPDSPAARAGLKAGDVITAANGRTIERPGDLTTVIRDAATTRSIDLRVMRDRKENTITVMLPERERPRLDTGRNPV